MNILDSASKTFLEAIEDATVYHERSKDVQSLYQYRYWGKQKDLVEKALVEARSHVDYSRSPCISSVHEVAGMWEGYLTYWSLGD